MEFLVLFMPFALAGSAGGLHSYFTEKALLRLVRQRYPEALDVARGRSRRWYDGPEELRLGEKQFRQRMLDVLQAAAATDEELAASLSRVRRADRLFKKSLLIGGAISAALYLAVRLLI